MQELARHEDRLLDLKESVLDPIRRFMAGSQKTIFDEARNYLANQGDNFSYGGEEKAKAIGAVLDDPSCFKGNAIQQIKGQLDALKAEVEARIATERQAGLADVEDLRQKLRALPEYASLADPDRQKIEAGFGDVQQAIAKNGLIAVIRERVNSFKSSTYPALLGRVTAPMPKPAPKAASAENAPRGFSESPSAPPTPPPPPPRQTEYVAATALRVTYSKPFLADERDVDAYLDILRDRYIAEIRAGKRVTV
jgi:hypothetical protein